MSHIRGDNTLASNNKLIAQVDINLLYINKSKFEDDWSSVPHSHEFTELFFILDGKGQFHVDGETISIEKNDLLLITPNIMHTEVSSATYPMEYYVLGVDNIHFLDEQFDTQSHFMIKDFLLDNPFMDNLLEKCSHEVSNQDTYSQQMVKNLAEIIIIELLRKSSLNVEQYEEEDFSTSVSLVKNYIDVNYAADITLGSLANLAQRNKSYLSHSFKETYGKSPINYLTNKRMEIAKTLLGTSTYQINEIANFVGYTSSSYFTEVFRKKSGVTPSEYRELTQKPSNDNKIL